MSRSRLDRFLEAADPVRDRLRLAAKEYLANGYPETTKAMRALVHAYDDARARLLDTTSAETQDVPAVSAEQAAAVLAEADGPPTPITHGARAPSALERRALMAAREELKFAGLRPVSEEVQDQVDAAIDSLDAEPSVARVRKLEAVLEAARTWRRTSVERPLIEAIAAMEIDHG
jgi:hypothetical protein